MLSKDYIYEQMLGKMAEFSLERGNQLLKDGLTDAEASTTVQAEVNDKFSESAIVQFIEETADAWVAKAFSDMDDKLTSSDTSMQSFLQHNNMLWQEGFDKSEMLYLMILEMSDHYQAYYLDLPDKTRNALENRYYFANCMVELASNFVKYFGYCAEDLQTGHMHGGDLYLN